MKRLLVVLVLLMNGVPGFALFHAIGDAITLGVAELHCTAAEAAAESDRPGAATTRKSIEGDGLFWQVATDKTGKPFGFKTGQSKADVTDVLLKVGYLPSKANKNELACEKLRYDIENCRTLTYFPETNQQRDYYELQFHHGRLTHIEFDFRRESFKKILLILFKNYGTSAPALVYGTEESGQYFWVLPNGEVQLSRDTAKGWAEVIIKDSGPTTSSQ